MCLLRKDHPISHYFRLPGVYLLPFPALVLILSVLEENFPLPALFAVYPLSGQR